MKKRFKVEELYKTAKQSNVSLLPVNTNFDWWEEYENNTSIYDRYILDTFRNFYYWVVFSSSTPADALADFKEAITSFLTINQKRFSELYRLHILPDSAYDIVNNYSVTENSTRTTTEGERSDTQANVIGTHTDVETNSIGERTDRTSNTIGTHTDVETNNIGERTDRTSNTIGERTDSTNNSIGARIDTNEEKVSAFNSSDYQDSNKNLINMGAQTNTGSATSGEQTNSESSTSGAQTNSVNNVYGEQTNSESSTSGAQTNSVNNVYGEQRNSETLTKGEQENVENYELTRAGNIGVQTPADVIGGHLDLWDRFNFYKQIFDEIAKAYFVCQNRHR